MDTIIKLPKQVLTYTWYQFKEYHDKNLKHDSMSAEQRWLVNGGKIPDKEKK